MGSIIVVLPVEDNPANKILDLMNLANAGLNQINNVQQGTVQRISEMNGDNFYFKTDSDAMIVKGLLSLIERSFNEHTAKEILSIEGKDFLSSVGLDRAISSQRTNGFSNAINKIQKELLT